jgi:dephospho-CoA kinase
MAGRIFAVSGLSGVGKTTAVNYCAGVTGGEVIYFGETVIRAVRSLGLEQTSENEQIVRIALRRDHGLACLAKAEAPRMKAILDGGRDIFVDAVYVREELDFLCSLLDGVPCHLMGIEALLPLRLARLKSRATRPMEEPDVLARDAIEMKKLKTGDVLNQVAIRIENNGSMADFESALKTALGSV